MSRPRLYSRYGCASCKRRKKKCDEQRPVCSACQRLNLVCSWPPPTPRAVTSGVTATAIAKVPLSPRIRMRVRATDLDRIDFFHYRTLPLLRLCQPYIDWAGMLGAFMHRSSACRNIVAALGTQQRLLMSSTDKLGHDADVAYQYAISSWRATLPDCGPVEAPMVIFGCLLLIILESMRESTDGLRTHLKVAVKMCNLLRGSSMTHQISGFFGLLQTLCTSTKLYHVSPFAAGPVEPMQLNPTLEVRAADEDLQFETQSAISNLIDVREAHARGVTEPLPYLHEEFQERAARLRVRSELLFQDSPFSIANHVNAMLFDTSVRAGGEGDVLREGQLYTPFEELMSLMERCVRLLKAGSGSTDIPFALGLDITQKLDLILAATRSPSVRHRALRLLSRAPAHEGLWVAGTVEELRSAL